MRLTSVAVRRAWLLMGLVWCLIFLYGCLMPNPPSAPAIPGFDKVEHAGAFVVMTWWFAVLFPRVPWRLLVVFSAYGAAIEVLQGLSGYRDGDPLDWLADTLGVFAGLALAYRTRKGKT